MTTLIKGIYKDGMVQLQEPLAGVAENQEIALLLVTPSTNGVADDAAPCTWADLDDEEEEPAFWSDPEGDAEWAKLTPDEQQGIFSTRKKTPEEIEADLRWIDENSGIFHLPPDQALEIAMSDALLEESQDW